MPSILIDTAPASSSSSSPGMSLDPSSLLIPNSSLSLRIGLATLAVVPVVISGVYLFPVVRAIVSPLCAAATACNATFCTLTLSCMTSTFCHVTCCSPPPLFLALAPCDHSSRFIVVASCRTVRMHPQSLSNLAHWPTLPSLPPTTCAKSSSNTALHRASRWRCLSPLQF
jgi:hypothetical protein